MSSGSDWIDNLQEARKPTAVARQLLAIRYETLTRNELPNPSLHQIVVLSRALSILMLAPQELPRRGKVLAESDWWAFEHGSPWPAYEPSVIAGALTLSCSLSSALRQGADATSMLLATAALDALPRKEQVFEKASGRDLESFAAAFRAYQLVPAVSDMRLAWIALAMMREQGDDKYTPEELNGFWSRLARVRTDSINNSELLRGLVLKQFVEPLAEVLTRGARERAPLDFSDLSELARCAPAALERQGTRLRVAQAFQARLSAVLRSFNGLVVAARPGEPLADIYWELPDGHFLLVDAKCHVGRGYALPSSDADALRRYVRDAPRLLPKGRDVRAVLIVGPAAGATLAARLARLEDEVERPVRFSTAAQVVSLRHCHPGGPLECLPETLRRSSYVLPDGWWQPLVDAARRETERLEEYLRMGLRR